MGTGYGCGLRKDTPWFGAMPLGGTGEDTPWFGAMPGDWAVQGYTGGDHC